MKFSIGKVFLIALQTSFLLPVFWIDTLVNMVIASILILLLAIGILSSKKKTMNAPATIPFLVVLGGVSTYYLNVTLELGAVIAASTVGLLASFVPDIFNKEWAKLVPAPVYTGAFVGMSSIFVSPNYTFILLSSMMAGGIYMIVKNDLNGYGGKLGSIAFSGVALLTLLLYLSK